MHFLKLATAYQDQPSQAIHAAPWPHPGAGEAEDQGERVKSGVARSRCSRGEV